MENKFQKLLFKWLNETATGSSFSQLLFLFLSLSWPFVYSLLACMHRCHSAPTIAPSSLSALLCSAQLGSSLILSLSLPQLPLSTDLSATELRNMPIKTFFIAFSPVSGNLCTPHIELIFHYCITIPNVIHDILRPDDTCITINLDNQRGQQLELAPV